MGLADDISSTTLRKMVDGMIASIKNPDGTIPTAFKDRLGKTVSSQVPAASNADKGSSEGSIQFVINPGGQSAWCKVKIHSPAGIQVIEGRVDLAVLATKLV